MVISQVKASYSADPMAASAAPRGGSQPHSPHDFSSSPVMKRWGNQRQLQCTNLKRRGEITGGGRAPPSDDRRSSPGRPPVGAPAEEGGDDEGIEELRAKLLGHLREAADRMKLVGARVGAEVETSEPEPSSSAAADAVVRPWNLRARRAACKAPKGNGRHPSPSPAPPPPPPMPAAAAAERVIRLRSEDPERRRRFSVSLSREEIEEDIFSLTGSRPRRRPKKRARIVQRQLDNLFPGLWLTEITADSYKVAD